MDGNSRSQDFSAFGGGIPKEVRDILESRGIMPKGVVIARGTKDVITALKADAEAKGEVHPAGFFERMQKDLEGISDVELHKMPDGEHVVIGSSKVTVGDADPDGLAAILKEAISGGRDRHPFTSDDRRGLDFAEAAQLREHFRRRHAAAASMHQKKPTETPLAPFLMLLCPAIGAALLLYARSDEKKMPQGLMSFVEHIEWVVEKDPDRFSNLNGRLRTCGFNLRKLADRLKKFAEHPEESVARNLADDFGRIVPAIICVMQEAERDAARILRI
jgi:hypothetical protein